MFTSLKWNENHLVILDQTYLPEREVYTELYTCGQVWEAIKKMKVRGAPAIGIAGAYGLYLGINDIQTISVKSFWSEVERITTYLNSSRPTAVNLEWALKRIKKTLRATRKKTIDELKEIALQTAITIHDEDRRVCKKIGELGQELIPKKANILTHCNTGSLATAEFGTALSVITHAHFQKKNIHVWVDETRPLLQGARLTAWELQQNEIPMHLITDSTAASLMKSGKVDLIIVGADRVAANGDTANKIGTYSLAVLAKVHNIPFYVALPASTVDMAISSGNDIMIEERAPEEVSEIKNHILAPKKTPVYNPAFDVTPNELITAFVTEKGIIKPPFAESFEKNFPKTRKLQK